MVNPLNLGIQSLINQDKINLENFPDTTVSDFYKSHSMLCAGLFYEKSIEKAGQPCFY